MITYVLPFLLILVLLSVYVMVKGDYWWKKVLKSFFVVVSVVLCYALIYQWGMRMFEGVEKSYLQSIQVVIESITTAGFGGDAPWQSDEMNLFILIMNLTGVMMVFFALPLFVVPLIREALSPHIPEKLELRNHVIICSQSRRASVLRNELESKSIPYVIIDSDRDTVVDLNQNGVNAVLGNPTEEKILEDVSIDEARAIVADLNDEDNSIISLVARNLKNELQIITVASDEEIVAYHKYAGADEVILPRKILGSSLASKAMVSVSKDLQGITKLGNKLEIAELLIEEGSAFDELTFEQSGLLTSTNPMLVGAWKAGTFIPNPDPGEIITTETILLLSGAHKELVEFRRKTVSFDNIQRGKVIIAGYGVVGHTIAQQLKEKNIGYTVVDKEKKNGVDIVGDATKENVLKSAGIEDAPSIILALDNDSTAIFTTLAVKQLSPNTEIIARSNDALSTGKLYRAGADYVLSLSTVSGRMIFSSLVESDLILSSDTTYEVVRTRARKLSGIHPDIKKIRQTTGATIIAIERKGDLIIDSISDVKIEKGDKIIVVGSDDTVNQFRKYYC
jgi:Trk K+ transport system NAD-binding subunit